MDTGDWSKAQRKAAEIEASYEKDGVADVRQDGPVSIQTACDEFLENAKARGLKDSTRYKYRLLLSLPENAEQQNQQVKKRSPSLQEFARDHGLRFLRELDVPILRKFRACWTNENFSAQKKLESLRTFFRFAQVNGWVADNPAAKLDSQKTSRPQVLPFTREDIIQILTACDSYGDNYGRTGQENA